MNSVADGIVLLDLEGTINWLSSSTETIFDYPRDAAVGASIDLLLPLPAEHGGSLLDRLQGPRPGGVPLELTLRRRSGELLPVEVESSVVEQRDRRRGQQLGQGLHQEWIAAAAAIDDYLRHVRQPTPVRLSD